MSRLLLLGLLLALSTACSTLATMEGAKPLAKGQAQLSLGTSVQVGGSPASYAGIPLPQLELATRFGVAEDVDVGLRLYLLGAAFDTRYRFWHSERTHLAVAPGLAGFWVPVVGGTPSGQGSAELRVPLVAEYDVARIFSVSGAPRLLLRDQWNSVAVEGLDAGASSRLDVYTGFGARGELHVKRFVMGLSGDVFLQPARSGGLAWSAGLDFGLRGKNP